ncbi:MAG TPA: carboxypeptidase-like regulatory domain-containing protein [Polyangia bacterium]|nr:carboxypeptidase-like regulatory domain-containing protein [Polyangia bacterium]
MLPPSAGQGISPGARARARAGVVVAFIAALSLTGLGACRRGGGSSHAPTQGKSEHRNAGSASSAPPQRGPSFCLAGQVVDRQLQPVPEARVLLWPRANRDAGGGLGAGRSDGAPLRTVADAAGRFEFHDLGPGPHDLLAEAPGFPPTHLDSLDSLIKPDAVPLLVHLDGVAQTLLGTVVTDGGASVPAALVLLGGETVEPQRRAQTGGDGRFAFAGLGPGVYTVRAIHGEQASRPSPEIVLSRAGPPPAPTRLILQAGWAVSGRVIAADGGPLPDSEVRIASSAEASAVIDVVGVDGSGAWLSRPLPAGEYRVSARHAGYLPRRIVPIVLGSAVPTPKTLTLELVRGAAIVGRIVDQHGRGVAGAAVRCLAPGPIDLAVIVEALPLAAEAAAVPPGPGRVVAPARSALSDRAGRFVLSDLLPGKVRLDVSASGRVPLHSDELALLPGQRRDVGDLVLADGITVRGRVLDEFHSPLEGARVVVTGGPFALTDGAGQFSFSLPPGQYHLTMSAPGMRDQQTAVAVVDGAAPPSPLEISLTRADAVLEGLVQDTGGRPIARAQVMAWPAAPPSSSPSSSPPSSSSSSPSSDVAPAAGAARIASGASILASTTSDVGGHFRLAALPRAPLIIEVRQPSYPSVTAPATPGVFATVVVPIPGAISGEVHDRESGAAIGKFRVEARGPDGRSAVGTRRKGGAFTVAPLVPGRWTVTVDAPGYEPRETIVDVPPSPTLGEVSVRERRIELQAVR